MKFWRWPMATERQFKEEQMQKGLQGLVDETSPFISSGLTIPMPPVLPAATATDRLGRNLERTVSESTARAAVLRQEIAAREAELADVLRAEEAARAALGALAESGHEPYAEAPMEWPFGKLDGVSPITDEDLSAACGRALEAEKIGDVK